MLKCFGTEFVFICISPNPDHSRMIPNTNLINQKIMEIITNERLKELAQINEPHCISIFIPTNRAGQEVNEKVDQKNLKNKIKEVKHRLESYSLKEREIARLLEPLTGLMNDPGFWKYQSDGLAIFRNHNLFEYYTLPVSFDPYSYIADHFYTLPIVPYINDEVKFFLLALSIGNVKFYEGFPHQINEVVMDDLLPGKLQEVVGFDFEEKHLQYRSGNDERGRATYHGHGSTSDEEKKMEITKYFMAVNQGLMKFLNGERSPLILATVDYLMPIYKEVNDYKYLHNEFIPGNPEYEDPVYLHERARGILEGHYDQVRKEKAKAFEFELSNQKASYKEEEIIQAAIDKRIDTLFVNKSEAMWGIYDKENYKILIRDKEDAQSSDLLNLAATHTLLNSGKVYLAEPESMPEPVAKLNAIFRY
jgi:hypothetical protein